VPLFHKALPSVSTEGDQRSNIVRDTMKTKAVILAIAVALANTAAQAEGDAENGETLFNRCAACHEAAEPVNKNGPHLMGIFGREIASVEDFPYSDALLEYAETSGTWDEARLDAFIADARGTVPRTSMAAPPLRNADDRADLIAYLMTLAAAP
jgi:cytochrome c